MAKRTPETNEEMKRLVREEIVQYFNQISTDVGDIKKALLGNGEYGNNGLVSDVKRISKYIDREIANNIYDREVKVIEWFEYMSKNEGSSQSKLQLLEDIIGFYKINKLTVTLFTGGTLLNILVLMKLVIDWFNGKI